MQTSAGLVSEVSTSSGPSVDRVSSALAGTTLSSAVDLGEQQTVDAPPAAARPVSSNDSSKPASVGPRERAQAGPSTAASELAAAASALEQCSDTDPARSSRAAEALAHARAALARLRAEQSAPDLCTASAEHCVGQALEALDRDGEARPPLREALRLRQHLLPPQHLDIAASHYCLSRALCGAPVDAQGAYMHAVAALEMQKALLPPMHLAIAASEACVAAALSKLGQRAEALAHSERALQLQRALLPAQHLDIALTEHNIAVALHALGRFAEALPHRQRAVRLRKSQLPEQHLDIVRAKYGASLTMLALGKPQALALAREAQKACEAQLGTESKLYKELRQHKMRCKAELPALYSSQRHMGVYM